MRAVPALVLATACLSGCDAMMPWRTRPAAMEFPTEQGRWRLGVHTAELELDGWSVRVADATVNAVSKVPRLETLVLEIDNTSDTEPLLLEPQEIYLPDLGGAQSRRDASGISGEMPSVVPLGPPETMVVEPGETAVMSCEPGMRAPLLPYPFEVRVTVFGDLNFSRPRSVTFTLY